MNTEENTMNIEEEIKQVWHENSVRLWAKQAEQLNGLNEAMKLELAAPELMDIGASMLYIRKIHNTLTFDGALPEELGWKQFAEVMPNLVKEVKENYDKLKAKVLEVKVLEDKVFEIRKKQEEERQARRAKLPWYKRWFV